MTPAQKPDRFPCPGCSADMEFDPQSGGMKCRFCGRTEALPATPAIPLQPHSLDEFLARGSVVEPGAFSAKALEITCNGCGAAVIFEPPQVAGTCSFCGAV